MRHKSLQPAPSNWRRRAALLLLLLALPAVAAAQVEVSGDTIYISNGTGGISAGETIQVKGIRDRSFGTGTIKHLTYDGNGSFFTDDQVPRKNQAESITGLWNMNGLTIQSVVNLSASGGALLVNTGATFGGAITASSGNITASAGSLHARGAVATAAIGSDNFRAGTAGGRPMAIFEDSAGTKQWAEDNNAGAYRLYQMNSAGTADPVAINMGDIWQYAPVSREILPTTPYGFSLGNPFFPLFTIWAAELNVQQLVSRENIITTGGNFTVGRSTTILEGITTSDTSVKTRHNDIRPGDVLFMMGQGKFEALSAGAQTPINRCRFNCAADDGTTGWAGDSTTVTFNRETRWQGEGAIFVPSNASQNVYNIHPDNYSNSATFTASIFIRRADGAAVVPGTGGAGAYRMLMDGTGVDATAIEMGNGWYRLWATRTVGTGGNRAIGVVNMAAGVAHYVDAAQIESGSSLTEYSQFSNISAVTRNLDGSLANAWDAGSSIHNTGGISSAHINAYADSSILGLSSYSSLVLAARPVVYYRFGSAGFVDAQFYGLHLTQSAASIGNGGTPISDGQGAGFTNGVGYLTQADAGGILRLNTSVSIEFWLWIPTDTSGVITAKMPGNGGVGNGEWEVQYSSSIDSIRWLHGNGTSNVENLTPCLPVTISLSTWYHIGLVRNSADKTLTCYVNGARANTVTYTTDASQTSAGLGVFAAPNGTAPLPASTHIDELAIYSVALPGQDFADHYDSRTKTLPQTQYGPTIAGLRRNSGTWSDLQTVWAIGNLIGHCDNVVMSYGAIFGPCSGSHLQMDNVNGVRGLFNTTLKFGINLAGVATFVEGAVTIDNLGIRILNTASTSDATKGYTFIGNMAYTKRPGMFYHEVGSDSELVLSNDSKTTGTGLIVLSADVINLAAGGGALNLSGTGIVYNGSTGGTFTLSCPGGQAVKSMTVNSGGTITAACGTP